MSHQPFDAATMPLDGFRLIEASAGTGKTFSLAGLYLRLLVEQRLSVREILVITFTRAATQELRERIRQRLVEAARIAHDPQAADPGRTEDAFAEALIAGADEPREALARRLTEAAHRIDEATITTIHGFSQRAAAENAFESALPFDRGEAVDDNAVYEEATTDYWRGLALGSQAVPGFTRLWPAPASLHEALGSLRARPHARIDGPDNEDIAGQCHTLRQTWSGAGEAFSQHLRQLWEDDALLKSGALYKAINACGGADAALDSLARALGHGSDIPCLPAWTAHLHDPSTQFKKKQALQESGKLLLDHPLAPALARLQPLTRIAALRQAHARIEASAIARKRERRQYSYADMIRALFDAIIREHSGPRLADALFENWPWALVDEFQDTDPLQYEILRRIYRDRERGGLILIGDPKQAIYGFRGGDVHAYLDAAGDAGGQSYSMDTNFRSTQGLLDGIEALFRTPVDEPFLVKGIEFKTVRAGRTAGRALVVDGEAGPPLRFWHLAPPGPTKGPAHDVCLNACAGTIRKLLDPQDGGLIRRTEPDSGESAEHKLAARDIAVLVNTNFEATEVQGALSRHGIPAVCLHRQSIFSTQEASDVLAVLRAVANPTDEGLIRGALIGPMHGSRLGDLLALAQDEALWQNRIERFQHAHEIWRADGVLAVLEPLVQAAAERLLRLEDGERRMSNYLQLAELAAQAESDTFGRAGLVRWLQRAIQESGSGETGDAEQLRLESDEALVRIVTVHRAKGLEYPVVFLPFAPWLGTMGNPGNPPLAFHDDNNRALVDIVGQPANRKTAIREAKAEALRQLYVAVTRAEVACFMPWGAAKGAADSALASLLHRGDGVDASTWIGMKKDGMLDDANTRARLDSLAARAPHAIGISALPLDEGRPQRLAPAQPPAGSARKDLPEPRPPWSIFSFTRLVHAAGPEPAGAGAEDEETPRPEVETEAHESRLPELPGGTAYGSAVHALLEDIENPGAWTPEGPTAEQRDAVAGMLRRYGIPLPEDSGDQTRVIDATAAMIASTLHTPLPEIGPLAGIPRQRRLAEMEFMLNLGGPDLDAMLDLLAGSGYAARLPRTRQATVLRGLMHGFIDLVVEHDDRFYVLDYKTNWLGPAPGDYRPEALGQAVATRHYDLQYLIYATALHRYLRVRLPNYDPARHLGGVFYLFLRGMAPDAGRRGIFQDNPDPALIERMDALLDHEARSA